MSLLSSRVKKPMWPYVLNKASDQAVGLVGWWPGDPAGGIRLFDLSGKGNHGTLTNFASPYTATSGWAPGNGGGKAALACDGVDDKVVVNNVFGITTKFTLSCWVYFSATTSKGCFIKLGATNIDGVGIGCGNGDFDTTGSNILGVSEGQAWLTGAGSFKTGWHHVAITSNGLINGIYYDGLLRVNPGAVFTNPTASTSFGGYTASGFPRFFAGLIEHSLVCNRALSAAEVWSLYDPRSRWDLRYRVGRKVTFLGASSTAIAFDAASNSGGQSTVSSVSFSVPWSGSNRMLAIDVPFVAAVGATISSVTYGGATCTLIGAQNVLSGGGIGRVEQWRICQNDPGAPAAGSNMLIVTFSTTVVSATVDCVSYTNVNQSFPVESWNGNSAVNAGSATDATVVVTPTADQCWCHWGLASSQTSGMVSSNTSRNLIAGAGGTGGDSDTGAIVTPPSTQTGRWTGNGITSAWVTVGYAIRPINALNPLIEDDDLVYQPSYTW